MSSGCSDSRTIFSAKQSCSSARSSAWPGYRQFFFFSSRRRHTRLVSDWSSDVCSSDLFKPAQLEGGKLSGQPIRKAANGAPILDAALAAVECKVTSIVEQGDHHIVVAEVKIGRASCRERV